MHAFHITGLSDELTAEVRNTMRSPGYGHPVIREIATGTGPCRACLRQFRVGQEERLLFTYRPPGSNGTLGAPGPVFIHAERCSRYDAAAFPDDLVSLPLLVEARASDNRVPRALRIEGIAADGVLTELLADADVEYLHVRHGIAGCHIARVDRSADM